MRELTAKPEENLWRNFLVIKAGALAMLGRGEEARAVVARTLGRFPDVTIEGLLGSPDWADHERERMVETMRKAGFPACVSAAELAKLAKPLRLPECESERAKTADRPSVTDKPHPSMLPDKLAAGPARVSARMRS